MCQPRVNCSTEHSPLYSVLIRKTMAELSERARSLLSFYWTVWCGAKQLEQSCCCHPEEKLVSLLNNANLDTASLRWGMETRKGLPPAKHSGVAEQFVFLTFMVIVHPCVKPGCSCKVFKVKQVHSARLQHALCQSPEALSSHMSRHCRVKHKAYLLVGHFGKSYLIKILVEWNVSSFPFVSRFNRHKSQPHPKRYPRNYVLIEWLNTSRLQPIPSVATQEVCPLFSEAEGCGGWGR